MAAQVRSLSMGARKQHGSLVFAAVLWSLQVRSDMFSYKERNKQGLAFTKRLVKIGFNI